LQVQKKEESKLLERTYVELIMPSKAGKITRKQAIEAAAAEVGVPTDTVGLVRLEQQSGTMTVVGKFHIYTNQDSKKRTHPEHLNVRTLTKEEREKLRQEKKKAKAPGPPPEAKK